LFTPSLHFFRDTGFSAAAFVFSGVEAFFCGGGFSGVIVGWSTLSFFADGAGASEVFPTVFALFGTSILAFFEDGVAVGISETTGKLGDCEIGFLRVAESTFEICSL
jgi:hypothetical protein